MTPVRVAMWSGPRNLSTALMRSWENRPDTVVLDEPLYAHYLERSGLDHPGREEIIGEGPTDPAEAVLRCLAQPPDGFAVSYQKHMSHHLLPGMDRSWIDQLHNFLLIRDPVQVLASYTRVRDDVTLDEIGLPQQIELAPRAELIIDAADFLTNPAAYLRVLCDRVGIAYSDRMTSWPPGRRESDGSWARYWYEAVEASTGFAPPRAASVDLDDLPERLRPLAHEALALYGSLAADRLVL